MFFLELVDLVGSAIKQMVIGEITLPILGSAYKESDIYSS